MPEQTRSRFLKRLSLSSSRSANATSPNEKDEKKGVSSPPFEECPPPYDSKASVSPAAAEPKISETPLASPENQAMLKSRQGVQDVFDKILMKDIGLHPTYTAQWASRNPNECGIRLRNILCLYLAIEYDVSPRPVVSSEDLEFFKRLIVFLLAFFEHVNLYGRPTLKSSRKGEVDLSQYESQVFTSADTKCHNAATRPRVLGLLWAHQRCSVAPHTKAPAGYAEGPIHSSTDDKTGYTPHNFRVSGTNRFFMDIWAAKGDFGRIVDVFEKDVQLFDLVFPKTDTNGRATALVNLKAMRKVYIQEAADEWYVYDSKKGGFRQGTSWGWKLTPHSKQLLFDEMVKEKLAQKKKEPQKEKPQTAKETQTEAVMAEDGILAAIHGSSAEF